MGFDRRRIVSDSSHFDTFICELCSNLVNLDAVVTPCNHPFCKSCIDDWITKRDSERLSCRCPSCEEDLEDAEPNDKNTLICDIPIKVQSLSETQPLAFQVLKLVQVACLDATGTHCDWKGSYASWDGHMKDHGDGTVPVVEEGPTTFFSDNRSAGHGRTMQKKGDATGAHHLRTAVDQNALSKSIEIEFNQEDFKVATERCDKLKKQANAKFNRGDVEGARHLYSEALALVEPFPDELEEVRLLTAALYSNRAVTYFRERILPPSIEDCNMSLELDPKSEKTYIRKWRALVAMGHHEAATACLEQGLKHLPESKKLKEELEKSQSMPPSGAARSVTGSIGGSVIGDFENTMSIASLGYANTPIKGPPKPVTIEKPSTDPPQAAVDRCERLKKQANARFNKGDIEAARGLYTDAISSIPNPEGCSKTIKVSVAMLYSNRAVTFFRDKMYRESLGDCEKSIELDPESEKSYIRKSRALVGLELHDEAYRCLDEASKKLLHSKKIKEELEKAIDRKQNGHNKSSNSGRDFDGLNSMASGDFQNSVGSFNFALSPEKKDESKEEPDDKDYTEDLELADKLKRNANSKFNRGDIAGARLLYTEALSCLPNTRSNDKVRLALSSLYANRAVTFFREKEFGPSTWDCDKAIELDPTSEKSYIRKSRALIALQRYDEAISCLELGLHRCSGSSKIEEELKKAKEEIAEASDKKAETLDFSGQDFQVSTANFDFDPKAELTSSKPFHVLAAVGESETEDFELPDELENMERAEKLKKQANAKLNKGDVSGARVLYGEGLACLPADGPKSAAGKELAASLYANRAVTFFREKKFIATVNDCDKSIQLDPAHEKSYIRKWRALMALGNFEEAYSCLQYAVKQIPKSERLNEELTTATEQKELLASVKELIAAGDFNEARETLKPLVKTSDNVSLWLAAARADACLGLTESALERVDKVLLFNAKHPEGLQVKGYATFLSGEMDHGISILKEALEFFPDQDDSETNQLLDMCHRTHGDFGKGQARVKRGRYKEAIDLFTDAMSTKGIPKDSPLCGMLLTERAEAFLLSQKYEEALSDCNQAIEIKSDNMTAWTVKIEVYFSTGKLQEARDELAGVRKTWGAGNETIEDAYKKTDFELRVQKADEDLHRIVASVENGGQYPSEESSEARGSARNMSRGSLNRSNSSSGKRRGSKPTQRSNSTSRRKTRKGAAGKSRD